MSYLHWLKKAPIGAALFGILLGAYSARAQEAQPSGDLRDPAIGRPAQGQDPFSVSLNFDRQADLATVAAYRDWRIAALWDSADDMLGANLQPVGEALRAQLDLPAGQGLVVEGLRGDGACAWAGLQQNDILLSVADKPLGTVGDLIKQLKAAGDSPVAL